MRIPRGRALAAAVAQLGSTLLIGGWCGASAYLIAAAYKPEMPLVVVFVAGALAGVLVALAGMVGAQLSVVMDAQADMVEPAPEVSRLPDGADVGGGEEHQLLVEVPEGVAPAARRLANGPSDPRWAPAMRRLAEHLVLEIKPEDGSLGGRSISLLTSVLAPKVPVLPATEVQTLVRDYLRVRAGHKPERHWRDALATLDNRVVRMMAIDLIGASRQAGLSRDEVLDRLDRLGVGGPGATAPLLLLADLVLAHRIQHHEGRYRLPTFMMDDRPTPF